MKEDFLHYLWKFKKFDSTNLKTFNGEPIAIANPGQYLKLAGPDFFDARIVIGKQKWAGNVEIHLKSSDWYLHHHETDSAYENVILHVVWEHDTSIFRRNNTEIPVLELKQYVPAEVLERYQTLATQKSWIYCERQLPSIDGFIWTKWKERLFFERLERKSVPILKIFNDCGNEWEATLFCLLAKNFGLNTNGSQFLRMAQSIRFAAIRKESVNAQNLEALFFGCCQLLADDRQDLYFINLRSAYDILCQKYQLGEIYIDPVQFFKHRPDNFPTIRLAQLAQLYHLRQNLFSIIIDEHSIAAFYEIFKVDVSDYWQTHYQFDRQSPRKRKSLSNSFIELLLINTVVPLQFAYAKSLGKDISAQLVDMMIALNPEKNAIIDKFHAFQVPCQSAFDSQSLLELKNEYCIFGKCLECAVGAELMKPAKTEKTL